MIIEEPKLFGTVGLSHEDMEFVVEEMLGKTISKEDAEKFLAKYENIIHKTMMGEGLELLKLIYQNEDQFQDLL